LASIGFAVAWTLLMWWWNAPLSTAATVILSIAGAIAGLLWYLLMGRWLRHSVRRSNAG
jgi:phosphate/sulfate permease